MFLGIGGIGMSAIARHYLNKGVPVFGYDKVRTKLTDELAAEGAIITYKDD
ncbi:MAG: Mur ligase domain-containing protein, partial [Cryomorphaceae bacterium]